jgi:hypothetical protein
VLILPPGHAQEVRAQRRTGAREQLMLRVGLALMVALVAVVAVALATGGRSSHGGCVDVTIPYALGGAEIYKCGSAAKTFCTTSGQPGGFTGHAGQLIATQCRKAGLNFG